MTQPDLFPPEELSDWQTRLLLRIQSLAAERARVLRQGYDAPARTHELLAEPGTAGISEASILGWRTRLAQLASARAETEAHARALGIAEDLVEDAALLGTHGIPPDPRQLRSGDRVREMMIDGVAGDAWQLQHMAAIHVAHRHLVSLNTPGTSLPSAEGAQFERNMAALWMRANTVAHAIGMTADECAGMWATDSQGWQQILTSTVFTYTPDDIEERWRIYAWRGIADAAERTLAAVGIDLADALTDDPVPAPHIMLAHANNALYAVPGTATDPGPGIDAALPPGTGTDWTIETDTTTAVWNSTDPAQQPGAEL